MAVNRELPVRLTTYPMPLALSTGQYLRTMPRTDHGNTGGAETRIGLKPDGWHGHPDKEPNCSRRPREPLAPQHKQSLRQPRTSASCLPEIYDASLRQI